MSTEDIKTIQSEIGVVPDGVFGPKSRAAAIKYLRSLCPDNPWPSQKESELKKFYGDFGDTEESIAAWTKENIISIDVAHLGIKYDGKSVGSIRCHRLVADSLLEILEEIKDHTSILEGYMGCFMIRKKKLGSKKSTHSWAIAIDLGVPTNRLHTPWPHKATMPWEVIKAFAKRGWMSGGVVWGKDSQHFQCTRF